MTVVGKPIVEDDGSACLQVCVAVLQLQVESVAAVLEVAPSVVVVLAQAVV